MSKRLVHRATPDARALREAMKAALQHLDYTDYLLDHRHWLGGATMTLADLAAAAQISVADYLGGIDWKGHEATAGWYRGFKRSEEHTSELQSLMRISYAVFCLKKKKQQ